MGNAEHMAKSKNAYKTKVIKTEHKKPLRRPSHRWKINVKTEFNLYMTGI
jgi:hypothetical protein